MTTKELIQQAALMHARGEDTAAIILEIMESIDQRVSKCLDKLESTPVILIPNPNPLGPNDTVASLTRELYQGGK